MPVRRRLVRNVVIDGEWWGPAYGNADQVPAKVARRITGESCWEDLDAAPVEVPERHSMTDRDLIRPTSADAVVDTAGLVAVPDPYVLPDVDLDGLLLADGAPPDLEVPGAVE